MLNGAPKYSTPLITAMAPPAAMFSSTTRFTAAAIAQRMRITLVTMRKRRRACEAWRTTQTVAIWKDTTTEVVHFAVSVTETAYVMTMSRRTRP